jgi:hypothetical protein
MDGKPKRRRWLRYCIGALLVATVLVSSWLGWQASIVRHRRILRDDLVDRGGFVIPLTDIPTDENHQPIQDISLQPHGRFIRQLLGDQEPGGFVLPTDYTQAEYQELRAAYPGTAFIALTAPK